MTTSACPNGRFPTEPTIIALTLAVLLGLLVSNMSTEQVVGLVGLMSLAGEVARLRATSSNRDPQTP